MSISIEELENILHNFRDILYSGSEGRKHRQHRISLVCVGECWQLGEHKREYPVLVINKQKYRLSLLVYRLLKGEIPENNVIRHTCDNPLCINPQHLLLGTQAENIQDAVQRNRMCTGENHPHNSIKASQVIPIYLDSIHIRRELADIYKVSQGCIQEIQYGRTWKHLTAGLVRNNLLTNMERWKVSRNKKSKTMEQYSQLEGLI